MTLDDRPAAGAAVASRAESPTGCQTHTRLYRGGVLAEQGFPVCDIRSHLAEPETVVWLDLLQPSLRDMDVVSEEFGLHPLAVEDALTEHQRPKLDRYPDHAFLAAYAASCAEGDEELVRTSEIAAFLTPRALITVRKDDTLDLQPLVERWDSTASLAASGVAFLAHGLLDLLVDGHTAAVAVLDDEAEELEDLLFDDKPQGGDLQRRSFELRKALTTLRRAVLPMRDVVGTMLRREAGLVDDRMVPYLHDVDDHVQRAVSDIDGLRDLLGTILDTNLTLASNQLNETVFRLTAWAAILAVTTAVTGYFGQNIPFPGAEERSGFLASAFLLVGSVTGMYVFFKRKGWL